jgi:hypothetical protein
MIYTGAVKLNIDLLLVLGMAICYMAGQLFAAYQFATVASVLLAVFLVRLIGGVISWVITGR